MIGRTLSHFEITAKLGQGGMGEVYRGRDVRLGREVAVKVLPDEFTAEPERLRRFQREARVLAALNHPGIATIYEVGEEDGIHFLVLELVEGATLERQIPASGMAVDELLRVALALTEAVAAAHGRGITHRDLKPANVMLLPQESVKVLDFGLARAEPRQEHVGSAAPTLSATALTRHGTGMGTLPYMSPEQVRGDPAGPVSDVFSLGVILFEMASGRRPFSGRSSADLASSILRDEAPALSSIRPDLPGVFVSAVARCLEKEPDRRFESARELGAALAAPAWDSVPAATSFRAIESIAVLPLTDLSEHRTEAFFAEGMAEALITDLAKVGGFRVVARASSSQFEDTEKSEREIGHELGVDALLLGSVLRVEERARISARLVFAETGTLLWAERYDRRLEDVLSLQAEVAGAIAAAVGTAVGAPDAAAESRRKVDPEVYLLDLRGQHRLAQRTAEGFRIALRCFQQAVDRDPTYAPAWTGLADAYGMLANYGHVAPAEVRLPARSAADRALELDPDSAHAHRVVAFALWQFEFKWQEAIDVYESAVALDSNAAVICQWFGAYMTVIGYHRRGQELLDRAATLDPLSLLIPSLKGWGYYFERRYKEALPYYHRVLQLDPDYFVTLWFQGETLVELGQFDEGIHSLERALELSGRISRLLGYLGYAYGRAGRRSQAEAMLAELEERSSTGYVPPYFPALVWSGLDEAARALESLEQAYEIRDTMIRDLRADSQWDRLRSLERFEKLMAALAFPNPATGARI